MNITGSYLGRIKKWVSAEIAVHKAISNAHHDKYTNAEAVTAVDVADNYVKNIGDIVNGALNVSSKLGVGFVSPSNSDFEVKGTSISSNIPDFVVFKENYWGLISFDTFSSENALHSSAQLYRRARGSKTTPLAVQDGDSLGSFYYRGYDGTRFVQCAGVSAAIEGVVSDRVIPTKLTFYTGITRFPVERVRIEAVGKFNLLNNIIKNPKNHAHSALSGTKKLVEIDIGGVSYYFEVYPTKA